GKIDVLENLLNIADTILIGGGMMYTFYKAMGLEIGKSLLEEDKIELAKQILQKAKDKNKNFLLPVDMVVTDKIDGTSTSSVAAFDKLTDISLMGVDIGPETVRMYSDEIIKGKTIVWNGPMGVFEVDEFAKGTFAIAEALANATAKGAVTIIGGGDSGAAIAKANLSDKVSHVSTGGGASLELLEGKVLPGVAALTDM
ncbi:MAG TPA: phosphoglycerate kinase, partial [Ignavibacteria bacterium]|nr:phosphoglycerate kinase [Ignavibacteria bacterium]